MCYVPQKIKIMTQKLRFALTAVLLFAFIGGAGVAAADTCEKDTCIKHNDVDVDNTKVVNDHDLVDVDKSLNDINANVLGIALQDSPVDAL